MATTGGAIPSLVPPKRAIRAAMASLRCRSSSSGSVIPSTSPPVEAVGSGVDLSSPSAMGLENSKALGEVGGDLVLSSAAAMGSAMEGSSPLSLSVGAATAGGGFHLGFSAAGLGAKGGDGAPKAPLPCKAAIRSFKLPPLVMLSLASAADIVPDEREAVLSRVLEEGEDGGDGTFGFQDANPEGLGRGAGTCPVEGTVADFSKAAILSRKEPGFGLGGGDDDC